MDESTRQEVVRAAEALPPRGGRRPMRLTLRHVEALRREIADPGPSLLPGFRPATDADYGELVASLVASRPDGDGFWIFAYGSLIWNPEFDFVDRRIVRAHGWRRSFCLGWDYRFRGNRDQPGLMLALDRGGQCAGVAFRLPDDALEANLDRLVRREMSMVPTAFPARWIRVAEDGRPMTALAFAMNRDSGRYISGLDDHALAEILARACGFRGSMAEYLHATVTRLEELGIHDRHLWRLQELVAEQIERANGLATE